MGMSKKTKGVFAGVAKGFIPSYMTTRERKKAREQSIINESLRSKAESKKQRLNFFGDLADKHSFETAGGEPLSVGQLMSMIESPQGAGDIMMTPKTKPVANTAMQKLQADKIRKMEEEKELRKREKRREEINEELHYRKIQIKDIEQKKKNTTDPVEIETYNRGISGILAKIDSMNKISKDLETTTESDWYRKNYPYSADEEGEERFKETPQQKAQTAYFKRLLDSDTSPEDMSPQDRTFIENYLRNVIGIDIPPEEMGKTGLWDKVKEFFGGASISPMGVSFGGGNREQRTVNDTLGILGE